MSAFDQSGSAFYSEPHPENIGQQEEPSTQALPQNSEQMPETINPQYSRYSDSGVDTFAPSPVTDPTFQPASQQPVQATGFQFQPWMLLAAGAALVLWMRSEK